MRRRDALRFAVLAVIASPLAAACGGGVDRSWRPGTTPGQVRRAARRDPEVVAALHALAGGLYGRLAEEPGHLVPSLHSVAVALGMTLPGAGRRAAAEMGDVLGVTGEARFHGGLNALSAHVEGLAGPQDRADGSKAELAPDGTDQLYGQQGVGWEQDFPRPARAQVRRGTKDGRLREHQRAGQGADQRLGGRSHTGIAMHTELSSSRNLWPRWNQWSTRGI